MPKSSLVGTTGERFRETSEEGSVLESIYQSANVYKGFSHETLVPVTSKGTVITWDFDIMRGQCEFLLLRTPKIIPPDSVGRPPTPPHSALPPVAVAAAIDPRSPSGPVAFDKALQYGHNLFIDVKPIFCLEGDSMQGSHYCKQTGTYILQWRHAEAPSPTPGAFDFGLPVQKCKVLYYHEAINSEDFKGSMASLESCRSSFSNLSLAVTAGRTSTSTETPVPGLKKKH